MLRRDFIGLIGGAAAAWPLVAGAQRSETPVVGYIGVSSLDRSSESRAGLRAGLEAAGYIDGKNVAIEYRSAEGNYDQLRALVDDLVRRKVAVIVAGGNVASSAAKRGTQAIPIVFNVAADPITLGLVASLPHPGGNATGVATLTGPLTIKRFELIRECVPPTSSLGFLVNPDNEGILIDVQSAAQSYGQRLVTIRARDSDEIEAAFASFVKAQVGGLVVANDAYFMAHRAQLIALAARFGLPAIYEFPEFPAGGGLMSYGPHLSDLMRLAGIYAGRILGGAKPADLPVQQATKIELVINLKTAAALGLAIPPSLLARADEVIE